jgi:hypothetical protein
MGVGVPKHVRGSSKRSLFFYFVVCGYPISARLIRSTSTVYSVIRETVGALQLVCAFTYFSLYFL